MTDDEKGSICFDCAKDRDLKGPGVVTCWVGECDFCKKEKNCCSVTDYHWTNNEYPYIWD